MAVNLADKYSSKVDQAFQHGSYTENSVNHNYDFMGVDSVKVYTLATQAPVDYDKTDTADRYGGMSEVQDTTKTYQLANDKAFKLAVDKGNEQDTAGVRRNAGKILKLELDEQIMPLVDKNRLATAATGATTVSQSVTYDSTTAFDNFLDAGIFLDEAKAPQDGRVCFVTPDFYKAIMLDKQFILPSEMNSKLLKKGVVGQVDGTVIVRIPTEYFPTNTKALLWHKSAVLGARKLTETRIKTDSEMISGALLIGRFRYDSFVMDGKKNGVASIVAAAA
jgi:N4-gp56 family major capsid protein